MTCKNCGNEMRNGDRFCDRCGSAAAPEHPDPAALTRAKGTQTAPWKSSMIGNLLTAGLQMLALFLWFGKVLTVSALGQTRGFSMHDMCQGAEFVSYVCAVLLTAGALISALSGLIPASGFFRKLPMVATAWTFVWYLVGVLGASNQVNSFSGYGAESSLTAGGWLLGIACIAAFVLLLLNGRQHKRNSKFE